jgi:diguanylate cyclase (GGDEF)-like protein
MYILTAGAGLMSATLGMVAATLLWTRPESSWVAAVPPAVLFFAYRAYLSQRLERDRVQSLYEVSEQLHRHPRIEDALEAAVDRAREMFDAETAEILLYPDGPDRSGIRTLARIDGDTEIMETIGPAHSDRVVDSAIAMDAGRLIHDGGRVVGMVTPIPGTAGVMRVAIAKSDIGGFGERDLQLLTTLAGHVGISIENGRLEDSLVKLTELKDQLRHQALHDGLTGVANRSLLLDRLVAATNMESGSSAILFLDLDDFKAVNDGHGHEAGDALLVNVARRLESCCRPSDTVARLGGDEFALLVTDLAKPDDVVTVACRITEALSSPFSIAGSEMEVRASIGVAVIDNGADPDEVLKAADEAMYVAKGEGKGTYRVYSPGLRSTHSIELSALTELRQAIKDDRLVLHYQPIFDLETLHIAGVEALVRWDHPEKGLIAPDSFVPLAERRGIIEEIGDFVLRQAADSLRHWRDSLGDDIPYMSVNLSANEIGDPTLLRTVLDVLAVRDLDPSSLQIEITEGALMEGGNTVLDGLRKAGVRVALDDFGTGYSSLAYLDTLPVDTVKLAREFIARIGDPRVRTIIEMMIGVGETLGFSTIAEGIERNDQLEVLTKIGCAQAQGFLLGKPMPQEDLIDMLLAERIPSLKNAG